MRFDSLKADAEQKGARGAREREKRRIRKGSRRGAES